MTVMHHSMPYTRMSRGENSEAGEDVDTQAKIESGDEQRQTRATSSGLSLAIKDCLVTCAYNSLLPLALAIGSGRDLT